jgi:hypothetical protein
VFKAIGMIPRQVIAMVVCWVAGIGLVAGLIALPAGIALHHAVLPVMASSANLGLPASYLSVYRGPELVVLALAGVVIAVIGALLPGGLGGPDPHRFRLARRVAREPGPAGRTGADRRGLAGPGRRLPSAGPGPRR